jgi:hypothetical protein
MQEIKIQNCTEYKDRMFKLFVNGEKHVAHRQLHKFQVEENKLFRIRAKYFWDGSSEYAFEPKENLTLQILINQRMINWQQYLLIIAITLNFAQMYFFEGGNVFLILLCFLCLIVPFIIRKMRYFVIREVNSNER